MKQRPGAPLLPGKPRTVSNMITLCGHFIYIYIYIYNYYIYISIYIYIYIYIYIFIYIYILISRPSFTTYSSESEFILKGYKSFIIFYEKLKVWVNFRKELFSALLMLLVFTLTFHMRKAWPHLETS